MKFFSKSIMIFLILFIVLNFQVFSQESSGESTGKKIGTIIKSAISNALPGVQTILELIWNRRETNRNRISQDDLQNAIINAQNELKDKIVMKAQNKLKAIKVVATELEIINNFLYPTVKVNENLIKMQTLLSRNTNISDELWNNLNTDMIVCNEYLKLIEKYKGSELSKISSIFVRDSLEKIRYANIELATRINSKIKAKDPKDRSELISLIEKFYDIHKDITRIVGYEIDELQNDLLELFEWSIGGMGNDNQLTTRQQEIEKAINSKYLEK